MHKNHLTAGDHFGRKINQNANSQENTIPKPCNYMISNLGISYQVNKKLRFYQRQMFIRSCVATLFTITAMTIGILVVCLAPPKLPDKTCNMTFKEVINRVYTYDSRPRHVAIADFDKDNQLDMVVANAGASSIGIRLGIGNGRFSDQISLWLDGGAYPCWVGVGDINNDGILDIAVANYGTHCVGIFLGYGNGSFSYISELNMGASRPILLTVNDFNQDGLLDIAVVSNGTLDLSILLGLGDGTFAMHTTYYLGHDCVPYSIDAADFNYDNQTDILIVDYATSNLIVLFSNENATFSIQKYSTEIYSNPCSVALADVNNDKSVDLIVVFGSTELIVIFHGDQNGAFKAMKTFSSGADSNRKLITVGDLNNDAFVDLIVIDAGNNIVIVLEGSQDETFSVTTKHSTGSNSYPISIAVNDFDNDKLSDVIVINNGINSIVVLRSYALGLISSQKSYTLGIDFSADSMFVYDVNNDGALDIVVADQNNKTIDLFVGDPDGSFEIQIAISTQKERIGVHSVAPGDFNKDNNVDIAVTMYDTAEIRVYLSQKDDSFVESYRIVVSDEQTLSSIFVDYIDRDKNLDIGVVALESGSVAILLGNGNGTFAEPLYCTNAQSYQAQVSVGDFNHDNNLDLAYGNVDGHTLAISLGNGDGTFQNPIFFSIEDYFMNSMAIGDLNNDKILDIVVTIPVESGIGIFYGYGNGTFSIINGDSIENATYLQTVLLGDFNKDKKLDIVILIPDIPSIIVFYNGGDGTFPRRNTLLLDEASDSTLMALADFNNDGEIDIVIGNVGSNDLTVLLLRFQPDFTNESTYLQGSGASPSALGVGDFNNDLQMDVVVANSGTNEVQALLDYSNGTFMHRIRYATAPNAHPQQLIVADFNNDNQPDVAVVNAWENALKVFLILNSGRYIIPYNYSTGLKSSPNSLAVGDFNNDGWMDVVVANKDLDNIGIFLGYRYPTFTRNNIVLNKRNSIPKSVAVGDFNNDNQWDIVVACFKSSNISVFLGYGNGRFAPEIVNQLPAASNPVSLTVSDFNNDNKLDIAVANFRSKTISVLLGYGNGTFARQISISTTNSSPTYIEVDDFNKDQKQDIIVAFKKENYIGIFLGYANGSFMSQIKYNMPNGSSPVWIAVNDLNDDEIQDIAVANSDGNSFGILLGFGNGTFENVKIYSTGTDSSPCSIAIGDFNRDNRMDIAVANLKDESIGIFLADLNRTFSSQIKYKLDIGTTLNSIVLDDVNNDTIIDIVVSDERTGKSGIYVLYGLGDGIFLVPKFYSIGGSTQPSSIAIADFDNDGRNDLVASSSNKNRLIIMLQYKSEPFGDQTMFFTDLDSQPYSVAVNDFNNDNRLDIVVANSIANTIGIFLGYGNGSFAKQYQYPLANGSVPKFITTADFNNDKQIDIVVANSNTGTICIFYGNGNGNFTLSGCYSTGTGSEPSSIAVADLNRDNQTDIVVTNRGINTVLVFYNYENGKLSNPKSYSLGYDARPVSVAIGDFDNNTLLDIVVTNNDWNYVDVLIQTC